MAYKQLPLFTPEEMENLKVPPAVEWEMFVKNTKSATYDPNQHDSTPLSTKKKRRKKRSND
mgnify:FL=1